MSYNSLCYSRGGGILDSFSRGLQRKDHATLAIGIGGAGIAALSALKCKIHQRLGQDNPGEATARYEGIQLLAIDSDVTVCEQYAGAYPLSPNEFFCTYSPSQDEKLQNRKAIEQDPYMNWLDLDKLRDFISIPNLGGIRQIGRYRLLSKVQELVTVLSKKCMDALRARGSSKLDVYVFAGLSGGTGSGCFLDVCYILRQIIQHFGFYTKIAGFFFLPDVVLSKSGTMTDHYSVIYQNSNGYAALKELDYHMNLQRNYGRFVHDYSDILRVDTQMPPVDLCHLISATREDGTLIPNGFSRSMDLVSEHVLSYIWENDWNSSHISDLSTFTMRDSIANISSISEALDRFHGGFHGYVALGACDARIPTMELYTYLASRFYQSLDSAFRQGSSRVDRAAVTEFATKRMLTADSIFRHLMTDCPTLELPSLDRKILATTPKPGKGFLNEEWAREGNNWLDRSMGSRVARKAVLAGRIDDYDESYYHHDSLVGRIHRELRDYCSNWEFGPYYAEALLAGSDYSLLNHFDYERFCAAHELEEAEARYKAALELLEEAKESFYDRPNGRNYKDYEQAVCRYFLAANEISVWRDTMVALEQIKGQAKQIHDDYFRPLCEMLSFLERIFSQNLSSLPLSGEDKNGSDPCHRHIVTLAQLQPLLDSALSEEHARKRAHLFMDSLMNDSMLWRIRDQERICHWINTIMTELFSMDIRMIMEEYFRNKYPHRKDDTSFMAEVIKNRILEPMEDAMTPMFWNQVATDLRDSSRFLTVGMLFIPFNVSSVSEAANDFCDAHPDYHFMKTGMTDRIVALCLYSGVPLYAYGGLSLLKKYYDAFADTPFGIGAHLYAPTGRGSNYSGKKDWRTDLPTPIPYSGWAYVEASPDPKGQELVKLYEQGEALGIIVMTQDHSLVLLKAPALDLKPYTLADFMKNGRFIRKDYDEALRSVEALKDALSRGENCKPLLLTDDGSSHFGESIVRRVRMDHFIASPVLQQLLREEIAKRQLVDRVLESLKPILEERP
ncbi:MAG: hypothetical protein IKM59_03570 [Oscillospiraceae bacterium]|nr:hypothetical protein [Oscillospiraceae bacterium]